MLIANVFSLNNEDELRPCEPQQNVKSEEPEKPQVNEEAETDNSSESEEEDSNIDTPKKSFSCPVCKKCFPHIKGVKVHLRTIHNDKKSLAVSSKENTGSLISNAETEQVLITQEGMSQKPDNEGSCSVVVDGTLTQGEKKNVTDEKPEEQASGKADLGQKRQTMNKEKSYTIKSSKNLFYCPVCRKPFTHVTGLKIHMRIHKDQKPLYFALCKSLSSQQALLQPDIILSKPFSCLTCFQGFKSQSDLDMHMRDHAEDKPGTCTECGASFPNQTSLNQHMYHEHSTDKHYKCSVCSRAWQSLAGLNTHMRVHTGEKPFMCSVCGKGFAVLKSLQEHETKHTK